MASWMISGQKKATRSWGKKSSGTGKIWRNPKVDQDHEWSCPWRIRMLMVDWCDNMTGVFVDGKWQTTKMAYIGILWDGNVWLLGVPTSEGEMITDYHRFVAHRPSASSHWCGSKRNPATVRGCFPHFTTARQIHSQFEPGVFIHLDVQEVTWFSDR